MKDLLTVIIPTYKRRDSLLNLIKLLKGQKDGMPQIIVIDQNTDNFFDNEALDLLSEVIHKKLQRPNVSAARNYGYKIATTEYILFLDDDLEPDENFCRNGLNVFKSYPEIQSFSPLVFSYEGKEQSLIHAKMKKINNYPGDPAIFSITDTISAAIFFRKSYYTQTGGFDEYFFAYAGTAEDQEFFLRMKYRGLRFWFVSTVEIFHNESMPGGCDLRTQNYWITREKCIKAWVYRFIIHNKNPGKLSIRNFFALCRSVFLNKEGLTTNLPFIGKQIKLMFRIIRQTRKYLNGLPERYLPTTEVSHIA
jgi:GT2 family glycosyltransferase